MWLCVHLMRFYFLNVADVYPRNAVSLGLSLCVHIFNCHNPSVQCEPHLAILLWAVG